jgi:hypothetical protein
MDTKTIHSSILIFSRMKNLIKTGIVAIVIAFTSCQKTEFASVAPENESPTDQNRIFHAITPDAETGNLLADKDKCKKCHTSTSRSMGLDLNAPFMSDNRYSNLEELINNFDFVNNVHLPKGIIQRTENVISKEQKDKLIQYLKDLK